MGRSALLFAPLFALLVAACVQPTFTKCPEVDCPKDLVCDGQGGCALPEQVAQCAGTVDGSSCAYTDRDGARIDGACASGVCLPIGCGNLLITPNEVCDDGNTVNGDGCSADCRSNETCGNGSVDPAKGEQCDDGNTISGDDCQADCKNPRCGDGVRDVALNEDCDAGADNSIAPDAACRPNCQAPQCGDGVRDPGRGEVCDDGNNNPNDGCAGDCKSNETCGNSVVDVLAGEVCDDGNMVSNDGCSADCRSNESCGNNVVDTARGEVCDDGNIVSGDGCSSDCRSLETCGNGVLDTIYEECDLAAANSNAPNSMCRTNCKFPACGDGIFDNLLNEQCDSGMLNMNAADACRTNCQLPRCGDTIRDTGEACDDGNYLSGDGCSGDCRSNETCGNSYIDTAKGEQCDAGAANSNAPNAACRLTCVLPRCGDQIVDTTLGESCDLGAMNSNAPNATCRTSCQPQRCGDSILDNTKGEVCDDGNVVSGDNCSADCKSNETCGNGVVDAVRGEQCDAGAANSNAANAPCRTDCRLPRCGDGAIDTNLGEGCDAGAVNSNAPNAACRTNCQPRRCGDLVIDNLAMEVCDDGNSAAGDGCSPDCRSNETCGNGIVDIAKGEQCDAGAANSNAANAPCRTSCVLPRCGDGAVDTNLGEACDAGAANSNAPNAACRTNCQPRRCGDLVIDTLSMEVCDDGNTASNDGCSPDCRSNETCGNGIVDISKGEQCDAGAANSNAPNAPCRTTCVLPRCGDGAADTSLGEGCDAGAANSNAPNAACRTNCQPRRCGDSIIDNASAEVCDDGNVVSGDNCSADCRSNETCPNGYVDTAKGEQCDDNNVVNNDFCHNNCTLPRCGDGIVDFNEQCDLGMANSNAPNAACRTNCLSRRCGDQIVDTATEVCDDGNLAAGDGCRPDCLSNESCGNGILDVTVGEICDDGNPTARDGCSGCRHEDAVVLTPGQQITYKFYHSMAYDAAREKIVLFYGNGSRETWEWDGVSWTQLRPRTLPQSRTGQAMAYDPVRRRVVVFGGYWNGTYRNDTWEWDGNDWTERVFAVAPDPRYLTAMAFDANRKALILYGGSGLTSVNDTWEYNGTAWTRLTTTGSPGSRVAHRLAWDGTRNNLVLYGGVVNGTRTWTFSGTTWTDRGLAPAGFPADYLNAMAYDPNRSAVVLWRNNGVTHEWNGTTWNTVMAPTPVASTGFAFAYVDYTDMVYDAARGQLVLAGGYGYDTQTPTASFQYLNQTWRRTGTTWSVAPAFVTPGTRYRSTGAYDAQRGRFVLFGGGIRWDNYTSPYPNTVNETWEWDGRRWTNRMSSTPPPIRAGHAMDYNRTTGTTLVFGGMNYNGTFTLYADLHAYNPITNAWSVPPSSGGRPGLKASSVAFDAQNNKVVTFGGMDSSWNLRQDTHSWDPTTGWVLLNPAQKPPARYGHAMGYDPVRRRVVLFGGDGNAGQLADTWEWDGTNWALGPGGGPTGRRASVLFYNPDARRMVLHGHAQQVGTEDLWEWSGTTWTQRPIDNPMSPNYLAAQAYFAATHEIVLYGGRANTTAATSTKLIRYRAYAPSEACTYATIDYDNDGLAGCADPDCWSVCTPLCPPGATGCPGSPRCGDGTCGALEDCDICPTDCTVGCPVQQCGDFRCSGTETRASCPSDCYQ